MGCGSPPALTAMEEGQDEHSLTAKPNGADDVGRSYSANSGADITSFPFSLGYAHFPRHDLRGDFCSYPPVCENENNRLHAYIDPNRLTNSETNANFINVTSGMSEFCRESEMSCSDLSMRELHHTIDGNSTVAADCLMKSEVQMDFIPPRLETTTRDPIRTHGAEARNRRTNRSEMSLDNFGVTGNKNDTNIVPFPFCSPRKVDRSFLTLGIGGSTEIRSNSSFNTQEIANKLEHAVSSQCNSSLVGRSPNNPMSLTQLIGKAARSQTNAGGLSSSAYNLMGGISSHDGIGFDEDTTSSRLNSGLVAGLQNPESNRQSSFSAKYDTFLFGQTQSSLPFGSNLMSQPEYATPASLVPETTKTSHFTSQSISQQQDYRKSSANASSESSRNYLSDRHRGSSISRAQLGKLFPLTDSRRTQSSAGVCVPMSVQPMGNPSLLADGNRTEVANFGSAPSSVQPVGNLDNSHNVGPVETLGNGLFPKRIGFQISKGDGFQSTTAGPFPKRLGVQPNDFAIARTTKGPFPTHLTAPVNPFRPLVLSGQHQHATPAQLSAPVNPFRPMASSGQHQYVMPAQLSKDIPRVDYSKGPPIHWAAPVNPFRPMVPSGQHQNAMPAQLSKDIPRVDHSKGPPPIHWAAPVNPFRPIVSSGQHQHTMPIQLSKDFSRVDYSKGHVTPVANLDVRPQASHIVSHPSLKRVPTEDPPTARLVQRRKIFPQPVMHHSTANLRQSIPPIPTPITARAYTPPGPLHVKWQGFDELLEPIGQKCLLCKRDLSFTAEGPVFQPAIPPATAVLPCGHTFHDHCLQIITPQDQSEIPPCIPCVIGET